MADDVNKNNLGQNIAVDIAMNLATGNVDPAAIATDILIDQLFDSLVNHYSEASKDLENKMDNYLSKFATKDKIKKQQFDAGQITKKEYQQWRKGQILIGKRWKEMSDTLAHDMSHANQIAADIINGKKSEAYALNHNYGTFEAEKGSGVDTSYTLYDKNTVERLIADNPEILPKTKINIPKDVAWNKKKITSAVTQGILQGEAIPKIAARMQDVTDMNKNAAIRNARTAMTGAQNAGRMNSYKRAEDIGIEMEEIWISTIDGRTRHSHRLLMGEKIKVGGKFSNGLRFPGDPEGPGYEVYNCRCTLVSQVKGSSFNVYDWLSNKLDEKGMTLEEWIEEKPLSKKLGETKAQYLKRYAEYKKKQSFEDWLGEQAAPDEMIESIWGDKKMSQMYNEIKAQNTTDANKFYKELGKLGKPPEVWDQYLKGQLDAEDMKNFEEILKKYLPKVDDVSDVAKVTETIGDISDAAKEAEKALKISKGNPMSKAEADTYKVNVFYDLNDETTLINCQTASFAYECRRQGYDVIALPKNNKYSDVFDLQNKLGKDQSNGWINKVTGKSPEKLIGSDVNFNQPKIAIINELEAKVGKNGERYTLGVHWTNGKAHCVNLDRDENGVLRIIDNQRGPGQKNTWTLEEYLDAKDVKNIRTLYRVDDCVPNPEYFNKIVVSADGMKDKIKLPKAVSALEPKQYQAIAKVAKEKGEKTADYYYKWKHGIIDNKDLDDLLGIGKATTTKVDDLDNLKKSLPKSLNTLNADEKDLFNEVYPIVKDICDAVETYTPKELWNKYLNGEWNSPELDDILKKHLAKPVVSETKAAVTPTVLSEADVLDKFKDWNKKYYTALPKDAYNKLDDIATNNGISMGDAWKKYLSGEIKNDNLDDILGVGNKVSKSAIDIDTLKTKKVTQIYNEIKDEIGTKDANAFYNELKTIGKKDNLKQGDVWKKYLADELDANDVSKIEKYLDKYKVTDKVDNTLDAIKAALPDKMTDLDLDQFDEAKKIIKKYYNSPDAGQIEAHYSQWKKGLLEDDNLDALFSKVTAKADDLAEIKKTLPVNYGDLDNISQDLLDTVDDYFFNNHFSLKDSKVQWEKYVKGEISDPALDKILKDKLPTASTMSKADKLDFLKNKYGLTNVDDIADTLWQNTEIFDAVTKTNPTISHMEYLTKYAKGEINNPEIDAILGLNKAVDKVATVPEVDLFALQNKSMSKVFNELKADKLNSKFYNELQKHGKPAEVWEKYLNGELTEEASKKIDDILIKKYSKGGTSSTGNAAKIAELEEKLKKYEEYEQQMSSFTNNPGFEFVKDGKKTTMYNIGDVDYAMGLGWEPADAKAKEFIKWTKGVKKEDLESEIAKLKLADMQAAQAAKAAEKSEELIKAEKKLKKAEDKVKAAEKALKDNVDTSTKWSGIWKEDVTLDDYASKKSAIAGKKQYYYDQIEELEHCIDDPDSWQFKKYGGEAGINKKIAEFETYIDDLDEYDQLGKNAEKYYEDIEKAKEAVAKAKQEVKAATPVGEAFTEERKANALWVKTKSTSSSQYQKADDYYESVAKVVHGAKTTQEHEGYYHYTWGSGPFNEPLYMRKNIDIDGYGDKIRGLTSLTEKSTYDRDVWLQSAQNHITIEAFLGIKPGTLSGMTVEEAQQFVGVQNEIPQFISTAINKGGGSYNPGNMTVNIYCPSGSEILYVRQDGHFGKSEHEMILQRGGTYKLTRIYKAKGTHGHDEWIVDLELHPEVGYDKAQQ